MMLVVADSENVAEALAATPRPKCQPLGIVEKSDDMQQMRDRPQSPPISKWFTLSASGSLNLSVSPASSIVSPTPAGWWTPPQVAEFLQVTVAQLANWRASNYPHGPACHKFKGRWLYRQATVERWQRMYGRREQDGYATSN